jgi:hypothetical protein
LLCHHLRQLSSAKIIVGGQGLANGGLQGNQMYTHQLFNDGLIDFWIRSEGEISLVELLRGNVNYPGINLDSFNQIDDLGKIPFPNYDNYNFSMGA